MQQVFKGKGRPFRDFLLRHRWDGEPPGTVVGKRLRYLPILVSERQDIFDENCWALRKPFKKTTRVRIDRILYDEKLKARGKNQNYYKTENVPYTLNEIADARLLCKNINGLIFLSREFSEMYPDATFIALIRNGLAICEGHIRRRQATAEEIARRYQAGCDQILHDAENLANYKIIRYEDLISRPQETLTEVFSFARLDIKKLKKVRLEATKIIGANGTHNVFKNKPYKEIIWYDLDKIGNHFVSDANENQIKRLNPEDKKTILYHAGAALQAFGYVR
ncbi:hypothetical protein Dole_1795 [Desulfosudis oleivorans Hxd3]|uniref:Sulfotransferase n=2 Tax=Desulfosudis TaxID=2904716 RepID=A9A0X4_DESOH|nr:hypothetical protein Dole_1795 [Desulfosudis oleivorans Hxd3]